MLPAVKSDACASLGDRKRQLVADELARAAMTLLNTQTYEETTIEQIAAAAGVSRRTYHRYFSTKQDVFLHFVESQMAGLLTHLERRPEDEPVAIALRAAISSFIDDQTEADDGVRMSRLLRQAAPLNATLLERQHRLAGLIGAELARRAGVAECASLKPRLLAELSLTALNTAVVHCCSVDGPTSLRELTHEALEVLARGTDAIDV